MKHCEKEKGDSGRRDHDMSQNRRNFIRGLGATLGSLIVSGSLPGCGPRKGKKETDRSPNTQTLSAPEWEQVRQCWLSLATLNEDIDEAMTQTEDWYRREGLLTFENLPKIRKDLWAPKETIPRERVAEHRAALDVLVSKRQLGRPVAEHVQVAFEEATFHIVRGRSTCYMEIPTEYAPRKDLLQQVDVLSRISADLDRATVAKAQSAIAQDMAFFENFETHTTFKAFNPDNYGFVRDDCQVGNLKASPEALEAARLLTRLFLETPD